LNPVNPEIILILVNMATTTNNIIQSIERYGKQLFRFIRGRVPTNEDAEDVLQEVWSQFSTLADTEAVESVSGWLYRVARNRIIDRSRKKTERSLEDFGYENEEGEWSIAELMTSFAASPEDEYLRNLFWEELFAALEELPEKQRSVFVLNELEDFTLQEIADQQGENLKTIISRKRYAVIHLRERLSDYYNQLILNQ
jgi:RNA polymerase sigma factor (sigma-70 family)